MNDGLDGDELEDRLPIGTVIENRYEITAYLGRGGFAGVYLARHIHLDRKVAVKLLDVPASASAGRQFRERFVQEAKIAARLKHPNVVDIFDFGFFEEDQPYIAMEFLEGRDLEFELRARGPLAPARARHLFDACLDALDEGHRLGIVHKDLKPSNLYLARPGTPEERLVLLDFGVARLSNDPEAKLTQTGGFSGTPAYLAPEYIQYQTVSPRLDVYQMGLILIETLTGNPAVTAESSMAYMMAHCSGEVSIPPEIDESVLGPILRQATALDPEDRYANAGEFRAALLSITPTELPAWSPKSPGTLHTVGGASVDVHAATAMFDSVHEATTPQMETTATDATPSATRSPLRPLLAIGALLLVLASIGIALSTQSSGDATHPISDDAITALPAEKMDAIATNDAANPEVGLEPGSSGLKRSVETASAKIVEGIVAARAVSKNTRPKLDQNHVDGRTTRPKTRSNRSKTRTEPEEKAPKTVPDPPHDTPEAKPTPSIAK